MAIWHIHLLNARNDLTRVLPELRAAARDAVAKAGAHADLPRFDLIVRARDGRVSERNASPVLSGPGLIDIVVDPQRFDQPQAVRQIVRELHRVVRREAAPHGDSLGEALVSEGLAGHFVTQVLGGRADPADLIQPAQGTARRAMTEWSRLGFDHGEWFLGRGKLRRGTGGALGHRLVSDYLALHTGETPITLATVRADAFREVMRTLAKADADPEDIPDPTETKPAVT